MPTGNPAYNSREYRRNRLLVLEAAGWRCQWPGCRNPASTADHIVPLVMGGTNDIANLRASCVVCNSRGGQLLTSEAMRAHRVGRRSRQW